MASLCNKNCCHHLTQNYNKKFFETKFGQNANVNTIIHKSIAHPYTP